MRQLFKRLLLPIAVAAVTQTSFVSAESIRLVGPNGEVQSAPQYSSDIVRNRTTTATEPSRVIGPTSETDTLWSIASRIRPSTQVSVQQTLLAIYRLNPQAFENQNIHKLIPGSTLRIPSLAQVSRVSTKEAVSVMAAHQARLTQQQTKPVTTVVTSPAKPVVEAKPQVAEADKNKSPEPQVASLPTEMPVIAPSNSNDSPKEAVTAQSEIQALEEKNLRLRLMLAEVQSEVSGLKQELGDENRIRSEVEKLLAEERIKREETQRLAPSKLDELLANNWVVAALALIPGLFIALLVVVLLGRRSGANQASTSATSENSFNANSAADAVAPIAVGDPSLEDLDDELLLNDDLFGSMDESDSLFGEEKKEESSQADDDDIFAGLDDSDLDFDLESEDGEDLFAAIDDSGDLDTDFGDLSSSTNGISVNGDEKALGLEDMERALDQASQNYDEDDSIGFDLSDDGEMSQADIESLLAADEDLEELESSSLDQSMLDELFSAQDEEEDSSEPLDFGSLIDDEKSNNRVEPETATFASDQEIDDLFASIEQQADLESLEANAKDESALLDELLLEDDEPEVAANSTALLDELLADDDFAKDDSEGNAADEMMLELDELLGDSEIPDIDENSTALLDDFVGELTEQPAGYEDFLADENALQQHKSAEEQESAEEDESLELFDELLNIEHGSDAEEHSDAEEQFDEFNSANFIDDLITNVPQSDPLLDDAFESAPSTSDEEFELDDFEFNPEIEGGETSASEQEQVVANEFGVPQDDDWVFDDLEADVANLAVEETESEQPEQDIADEFDDLELPEYTEEDALADSQSEPEEEISEAQNEQGKQEEIDVAEAVSDEVEPEQPEQEIADEFDDLELPEYTEEDALADSQSEPEEEISAAQDEQDEQGKQEEIDVAEVVSDEVEPEQPEQEIADEFDDLELPEYTEEDALADSESEPETDLAEVESEVADAAFEDSELPEYTEEDALADMFTQTDELADESDEQQLEDSSLYQDVELATTEVNLSDVSKQEFDEQALSDWLSDEEKQDTRYAFDKPIDAKSVDSAGMDIDAMLDMGGEDWNGFNLTPDQQATISDEVPEAEKDVWHPEIQVKEPEVAKENWEHQDDFAEFEPATHQFMTIDDLMAQVESNDGSTLNLDNEELKLDVGLNEFPDVIGHVSDIDVDSNSEAAGKLDLAKIYIEMNDDKGAIKLLEEAIVDGSDEIRQQAKHLIDVINGRA
ncbi:MAG: FimV/HubP family polar landmark protein [Vibrio sp.]|uniref:FimV/HubP family polar landmark protein n=1 Tax=Vibrio sp. TaxID=678 RepID=UPI003A8B92CC